MRRSLVTLFLTAMVLAACGRTASTTTNTRPPPTTAVPNTTTSQMLSAATTTTNAPALGAPEKPIQILFAPLVEADVIDSGGEVLRAALEKATGLNFEVSAPSPYATTIKEMCAAPERTMGFMSGIGYVLASNLCGVDVALKAVRFGYDVYWSQFLVQRDSDIASIEDLKGLSWAYPDAGSTSGYMVPLLTLREAAVEPGATLETGDHTQAALAIYRGDAEFATTFYSPPLLPEGHWQEGDDPDIPVDLVPECAATDEGQLWCGDLRVLDARALVWAQAPDIVQQVRILQISQGIPNDAVSFGPDFPTDIRTQIEEALVAFATTPEWEESIGDEDFYGWSGINPAEDAEYDGLRQIVELIGISLANL